MRGFRLAMLGCQSQFSAAIYRRHPILVFLVASLVFLLSPIAAPAASSRRLPQRSPSSRATSYFELIEGYVNGGDEAGIVEELIARTAEDPNWLRQIDVVGGIISPRLLRAAAILHTVAMLKQTSRAGTNTHYKAAKSALDRLRSRGEQDFYVCGQVVLSSILLSVGQPDEARRLPDSRVPDLLLLQGAISEAMAADSFLGRDRSSATTHSATLGSVAGDRHVLLLNAERSLREAAAADPGLVEARVRLGRVLSLEDRPDQAVTELTGALQVANDSFLGYLSALFLGGVLEQIGRAGDAERAYRTAIAFYPEAQTANIALLHLLFADPAASPVWRSARASLISARQRDPWMVYRYAQYWQIDARLATMRHLLVQ
jgi:hypothetical protein